MRKVEVIEVVIGALGKVTTHFDKWKPCLLGTESLFTWNGENNTESVGYGMRKKKLHYLRQLVRVRYCRFFYQEITSDMRVKEIMTTKIIICMEPS